MGKNYTLYLRHPKFDQEDNKSGLVNDLLEAHYNKDASSKKKMDPLEERALAGAVRDELNIVPPPKIAAEQPSAVGGKPGEVIPFKGSPRNPEFEGERANEKLCCQHPAPCQHWQWDGVDEVWKNSLSGRTRTNE